MGGLFSLTGNWATLGVTSKAAMEIGIEDVNPYLADGGSGIQFTRVIKDTKLDPATALAQITAFKEAGVEVVIGPQSSAEVAAIKSYADANAILVASQSSTAGTLAIAGDNIFRFTPSDTLEAVALVGLMKADGMKTIIPFWRNDAGNIGLQVATRALFARDGNGEARRAVRGNAAGLRGGSRHAQDAGAGSDHRTRRNGDRCRGGARRVR